MNRFTDNGDTVSFDMTVTNTGDVAGKDVAQVYFTPPYSSGGIEKASANLLAKKIFYMIIAYSCRMGNN